MKNKNKIQYYTVPLALGLGLILVPNASHGQEDISNNSVVTTNQPIDLSNNIIEKSIQEDNNETLKADQADDVVETKQNSTDDVLNINNDVTSSNLNQEIEKSILPESYIQSENNINTTPNSNNVISTNNLNETPISPLNVRAFAATPESLELTNPETNQTVNTDLKDYNELEKREKDYDSPNEGLKYGNIQYKSYDAENKELDLQTVIYASRRPGDWSTDSNDNDAGSINLTFRNPDFANKIEKIIITDSNGKDHEFDPKEANNANWQFSINDLGTFDANKDYSYPVKIKLKEEINDTDKNTLMEMVWINKDSKYDPYSVSTTTFDESGFDLNKESQDLEQWIDKQSPVVGKVIYDKGDDKFKTVHALTPNNNLSDPVFENSTIFVTDYIPKELVPYLDKNVKAYRSVYDGNIEPNNNTKVYNITLNDDGSVSSKSSSAIGESSDINKSRQELDSKEGNDLGLLHADTIGEKTYPIEYTFEYTIKEENLAAFNNELRKLTKSGKANVYSEHELYTEDMKIKGNDPKVINESRHFMAFPIIKRKEILESGFVKYSDNGKTLKTIYQVTNDRTGESHIIATDENGKYVFKNNEGVNSNKINQNDQFKNSHDLLYYDAFIPNNTIEFNDMEDNDTFTIKELRSETNLNHNLETFKYKLENPDDTDYLLRKFTDLEGNELNLVNQDEIDDIDKQINDLKEKQAQVQRLRDLYNLLNLDVVKEGMMPIKPEDFENKWLSTIYEQNVSTDRLKMYKGEVGKEVEEINLKEEPEYNYYDDVKYSPYSKFIDETYPDFQNYLSNEKDSYGIFQLTTTDSEGEKEVVEFIVYYQNQSFYNEETGNWQDYTNQVPKNLQNLDGVYEGENKTISLLLPLEQYQNFSPNYNAIMLNMLGRPDDDAFNYDRTELLKELGANDITQDQLNKFVRKNTLEGLSNDYLLNVANNFTNVVKDNFKSITDLATKETDRVVDQPDKDLFLQAINFMKNDFDNNYDNFVNEYGRFGGAYKYFDSLEQRINEALEQPIEEATGMNIDQYKQYIKKYMHKLLEENTDTAPYSNALDDNYDWWADYYSPYESSQTSDIVFGLYTKYHREISQLLFKDPYQNEIEELEKSKVKLYKVINEKMIFVTDTYDKADNDKEIYIDKASEIYDKVIFDKFNVGSNYEFKAYIVNKQTGAIVKEFEPVSHKFTQEEKRNGEITLKFVFDSSKYKDGDEFVIFYEIYEDGKLVAVEEDINNAKQSFKLRNKVNPSNPLPAPQPDVSYVPMVEIIPIEEAKVSIPLIDLVPSQENKRIIPITKLIPAENTKETLPLIPLLPAEEIKQIIPLSDLIPAEKIDNSEDITPEPIIIRPISDENVPVINNRILSENSNPKTGINGLGSVIAIMAASISGLFKTRKND